MGIRYASPLIEEVGHMLRKMEEDGVHLRNSRDVEEYLLDFPGIVDVLPRALRALKKHMPDAQVILDVYHDPEIEDHYLTLCVRLQHYDESFMDRLERTESEFIELLSSRDGWLQLTTDFREKECN